MSPAIHGNKEHEARFPHPPPKIYFGEKIHSA